MNTYQGSCQCQTVTFTVEMEEPKDSMTCDCSRCGRLGWLLAFVPVEQFQLLTGADNLTKYQFNKKHVDHLFCATCGIQAFAHGESQDGTGATTVAINLRCLTDPGFDLLALPTNHFHGKDL